MAILEITFKGTDEASGAARQVADDVKGVGDAASQAGEQGGGFFSGLLQTAGGFLAANVIGGITSQITGFVSDAIGSAREANALMAQTESIIKSTGGAAGMSAADVADLASSLSAAAGKSLFGDDQIQGAENVLIKYKELKGIIPDVTKLSVDMAARLGGEPAAAAETLGRALAKPEDAAGKLAKMGIILSDAQEKQIKTMVAAGNTAGAQAIIMGELNKSFGGAAQAAADADGGMAEFKDRLGEMGESLGQAVLPVLNGLFAILNDDVMPVVEDLAAQAIPALTSAWNTIKPVIDVVLAAFGSAGAGTDLLGAQIDDLASIWVSLQPVIEAVVNTIRDIVLAVFGIIQGFLEENGDDIKNFLKETWDAIADIIKIAIDIIKVTIVPALQAIAKFISDHSAEIQAVLKAAWTIIKTVIDTAITLIKGILRAALQIIQGDWSGAWETIKGMLSRVWDNIKTIVGAAIDIVKNILSMAWDAIKGKVTSAWDGIKSAITSAWDGIKSNIGDKIADLKEMIEGIPKGLEAAGRAIVQAIWDGIKAKWQELVDWFKRKMQELKDQLPFSEPKDPSSPLRGLAQAGESIVRNIQQGIAGASPLAVGAPLIGRAGAGGAMGRSLGGAAVGATGAAAGHITISVDDRGLGWLKQMIRFEVQSQTAVDSRRADIRQRT